jgi:hypothetical protein
LTIEVLLIGLRCATGRQPDPAVQPQIAGLALVSRLLFGELAAEIGDTPADALAAVASRQHAWTARPP